MTVSISKRRILATINETKSAIVYYDTTMAEYSVRFWDGGVENKDVEYFCDEKNDAISTAKAMVR